MSNPAKLRNDAKIRAQLRRFERKHGMQPSSPESNKHQTPQITTEELDKLRKEQESNELFRQGASVDGSIPQYGRIRELVEDLKKTQNPGGESKG